MIVGIDLGTSNSAISVWRDGKALLIPNNLGHVLTPSAVSVEDDGTILVGLAARERMVRHPAATATCFKRYMGTQHQGFLGGRMFRPEELSALVLRSLKADAEAFLGEPVIEAVITVPAYFNDIQRKATRRAGELAGLKVQRLLNEPTAAALAYGIHQLQDDTRFLVFDLGGGTFDVSILEIFSGVIEVRASTGDSRLGGEDFNEVLVDAFFDKYAPSIGLTRKEDSSLLYQLMRDQAERARRELSRSPTATMSIPWDGKSWDYEVTQDMFEELSQALISKLREPVLRALRDGSIRSGDIHSIVLAGGATRMPVVRKAVATMFGRFPSADLNPDEVVALGAAIQAGLKSRDAALREVVVTDVCPHSLGIDIAEKLDGGIVREGVFSPIIERNTIIPASRCNQYSNITDGQFRIRFGIYQGESRLVKDNVRLGELEVPIPQGPAGSVVIECRFSYDINGLLEVDVTVPSTGVTRQAVVLSDTEPIGPDDLAQRRAALARLKINPKDQEENCVACARAERCYEQFLGEKRERVHRLLHDFENALAGQDPREIERVRDVLHRGLDEIEGERYL